MQTRGVVHHDMHTNILLHCVQLPYVKLTMSAVDVWPARLSKPNTIAMITRELKNELKE